MTIKISQLTNLTVVQANTIVPVVSNITGTLTTVQANIQQLQDYIVANGVSANITALYANAATQSDLIIGINANVTQANLGMKGYVDSVASQSIYGNANVLSYLTQFDSNIVPSANVTYDLGSNTNRWKDLYLSGTTIFLGDSVISTTAGGGVSVPTTRFLGGDVSVAFGTGTYTVDYLQTPGSTLRLSYIWQNTSPAGPGGGYVFDPSEYSLTGTTLTVTADPPGAVNPIGNWNLSENYVDSGDLISATEVATDTITPTSGDLTVSGNVTVDGDLYVSPTSIYMGNLRISAADGNLKVNTGIKFSDDSVQSTAYSNVKVATYLPTYTGNIANVRLDSSGVLTFADGTTQTTAGTYSNVQALAFFITNLPAYEGNVGVNVNVTNGTVTASSFVGNGSQLTGIAYTMGNVAHWTSNVTTISAALDQLAERIYNIENP